MGLKKITNMLKGKGDGDNPTSPDQDIPSVDPENNKGGQQHEENSRKDLVDFLKEHEMSILNDLSNKIRIQIDSVSDKVNEILDLQKKASSTFENNSSQDFAGKASNENGGILLNASIFQKMNELIENIDYNIRNQNSSSYSKDYVENLQSQINEYREDVFLKLMRKYFVDVYSRVYRYVALLRFQAIRQGMKLENPEIESILREIETSLSIVDIEAYRSKEGEDFNDKKMLVSDKFERVTTDDSTIKGKVAFSVIPQFIVQHPSISNKLLLNMEEVVLYESN